MFSQIHERGNSCKERVGSSKQGGLAEFTGLRRHGDGLVAVSEQRGAKKARLRGGWLGLFRGDQSHLTGDALPGLALSDPSVDKALTLRDAFSFLGFADAKDANGDGRIAVDFGADIFIGRFRRLVGRILNAGQELPFAGQAAIDIDCNEGGSEKLIEPFGVLGFNGTVPGVFESDDTAGVVLGGLSERKSRGGPCYETHNNEGKRPVRANFV